MKLTGFTDEAATDLDLQIKVTKELGWDYLSARTIGSKNIHDIDKGLFLEVKDKLDMSGVKVAEFGTLIGNWSKSIQSEWAITESEVERCCARMNELGVKYARVMSYAQEPWGADQFEKKRFYRLREITKRFKSNGLQAVHENCMNWGGFSADHTLRLLDEVPDLKLVFDTGNPVFQRDRSKEEPYPWQNALEFYHKVKDHIAHVHVKDAVIDHDSGVPKYVFAGEGEAYVTEILTDLLGSGYTGFLAIEPHVGKVFHEDFSSADGSYEYDIYLEYGKRFETLVNAIKKEHQK